MLGLRGQPQDEFQVMPRVSRGPFWGVVKFVIRPQLAWSQRPYPLPGLEGLGLLRAVPPSPGRWDGERRRTR